MSGKRRFVRGQRVQKKPSWLHTTRVEAPSPPKRKRNGRIPALILLGAAVLLVMSFGKSYCDDSVPGDGLSVELSAAEADSIISHIDGLEIDLWECRALAANDSVYSADRLFRQERMYEEILQKYKDEQPNWLERTLKQPVVWLAIGMWLGVQAP